MLVLTPDSGLARTLLRSSAHVRPTATRRAFQPLRSNLAPALGARFASADAREGKIHQVIGAVVDGMCTLNPSRRVYTLRIKLWGLLCCSYNVLFLVKFDTEKLPPILNALTTDNGGNRLVLEVAVRL